jgi:hypothetical protein
MVFKKSCHFFDLMRLITGQEARLGHIRAIVQRGVNYNDEPDLYEVPIMSLHPFKNRRILSK